MKTLDEVITALKYCTDNDRGDCRDCPYHNIENDYCFMGDKSQIEAIYYLEQYQKEKAEQEKSEPLTWKELRQMVNKPVWVEWDNVLNQKSWCIVGMFHNQHYPEDADAYVYLYSDRKHEFYKGDYGTYWRAYRKE